MTESAGEAALTSKIKAKMVLDDTIKARSIDVTTDRTTVTVSGVDDAVSQRIDERRSQAGLLGNGNRLITDRDDAADDRR